ncbi:MAG: transglycosylase domain-containing protein [Spirochaetaceae bacterium]|nr:transglycosylase domain-containing protein [Spirochaetaceae bacterium]
MNSAKKRGLPPKRETRPAAVIAAGIVLAAVLFFLLLRFLPYRELDAFRNRPYSLRLYDRNRELIQIPPLDNGLRREFSPLNEIPPELAAAFIAAEDMRFYSHRGIDLRAVLRAAYQNIRGGRRVSGASTITMQLARIISPPRSRTLGAKIAEAWNALRLEMRLSKDEILELYLNSIPFGYQVEGVTSAARTFFSSGLSMLSPSQMFCLAVIPRRPSAYNPLYQSEACINAAKQLHARFVEDQAAAERPPPAGRQPRLLSITEDDWRYASEQVKRFSYPFLMPHFVRYVLTEFSGSSMEGASRGELVLSVDISLQQYIEDLISSNVTRYYESRLTNGAAIVMDNRTGEILAWVGSADYNNAEAAGQIDGVLTRNQPGSAMKPFLYALALENGFAPHDVLADIPMNFGTGEVYIPQNFNNRFNGPVRLREALASSLNIPAVYLLYRLGIRNYTAFLSSLGFASLEDAADYAGLGLALGNAPVTIAELVHGFSVFPRDGTVVPLVWTKQDSAGSGSGERPLRVISADTARILCSFLSDRNARVLAFGGGRNFSTPFPAIFKTGTANQYQNITALGATPLYSVAVWMGNFTGETVIGKTGSSVPAAVARDTLVFLQRDRDPSFPVPEQFSLTPVCSLSGMAPTEACLSSVPEYVHRDTVLPDCTWHRMENGRSSVVYPAEYQSWFFSVPRQGDIDHAGSELHIVTPREGFVFLFHPGTPAEQTGIPVEVIGGAEDSLSVEYDGNASYTVQRPFRFYLPYEQGKHLLTVSSGGESVSVSFSVE